MSNEQFDDIAVLKTLAQLRREQILHPDDEAALLKQLKSAWGRSAAEDFLTDNEAAFADSRSVLRKFSTAAF